MSNGRTPYDSVWEACLRDRRQFEEDRIRYKPTGVVKVAKKQTFKEWLDFRISELEEEVANLKGRMASDKSAETNSQYHEVHGGYLVLLEARRKLDG